MNLLQISRLNVHFDGQPAAAVADVSLHIAPGEVLALAGESGSGKSVTAAAVLGLLPAKARVSGDIRFDERPLLGQPEKALNRLRGHDVAMVFQNSLSTLDPSWTVGSQLRQNLRRLHPGRSGRALRDEAIGWLVRMQIRQPERVLGFYPHQLSGGMRQRILIALAAMCRPRLLIADEPTTALDPSVQREVLQLLKTLCREERMAMLLITHDFGVVAELSDRVAVMQRGAIVESGATAAIIRQPQHPYTRALLAAIPRPDLSAPPDLAGAATLLEGRGLHRTFWHRDSGGWWPKKHPVAAVDNVSLRIREGEIVGVIGESGSGKSTLARLLAQLTPADGGELLFAGQPVDAADTAGQRAFRQRLQCVFQDSLSSFNPRLKLVEQLIRPQLRLGSAPDRAAAADRARRLFAEVGLSETLLQRFPHELSGGQRQRANIARALVVEPQLLILDEPTSALDLSVQDQVLQLLERLHRRHRLACLLISHNLAVVAQFCHRVLVMDGGQIVDDFPRHELYSDRRHAVTQRLLAANYLTPDAADGGRPDEKRRA